MREQPNFSYNKKHQNTVQASLGQPGSTSNSSSSSTVKPKGENIGPVLKVPTYESSSKQAGKMHLKQQPDGPGHVVQLQQRSGIEEVALKSQVRIKTLLHILKGKCYGSN